MSSPSTTRKARRSGGATPGLALAALLLVSLSACSSSGPVAPATQADWAPINATLSVDELGGLVPGNQEASAPAAMSLAEARARVPFAVGLPAWVPDGFALQDEADIVLPTVDGKSAALIVTFQNAAEDAITLQVSQGTEARTYAEGAVSAEQIQVNGQPATLARSGFFNRNHLGLSWKRQEVSYSLAAEEGVVSAEDLVRMAESVK